MVKRKCAYVKWRDASCENEFLYPEEFKQECIIESFGIISKEDDKTLTLSLELWDGDKQAFRHNLHIPKVYIKKIKRLCVNL